MQEVRTLLEQGNVQGAFARLVGEVWMNRDRAAEFIREAAPVLIEEIRGANIRNALAFVDLLRQGPIAQYSQSLIELLEPPIERARYWVAELEAVTRERLAREARAAVVAGDLKRGVFCVHALIHRGESAGERERLARYAIEALGWLILDYEKSRQVLAFVLDPRRGLEISFDWDALLKEVNKRIIGRKFEESDREWTQAHTNAAVTIRELLPGAREFGEPTEENELRFADEAAAIINAALMTEDDQRLIDAFGILREYCPTDPSNLPSIAGAEQAIFLNLSNKAKLTTVRGMARLGQSAILREQTLRLARSPLGEGRAALFAAVMGGLRHEEFGPYLIEEYKRCKTPRDQERLIEALSRIGDPAAITVILEELGRCVKKTSELAEFRRAKALLTNLGRIVRAKGVTAEQRNRLIAQAIQTVGEKDSRLATHAAAQLFVNRVDELDPRLREWAARVLTHALFSRDVGENLKATNESPMGFREPIVAAMGRLGKDQLPTILALAEPHVARYSGALNAFTEVMAKIGDERALPLLERMIAMTFQHADNPDDPVMLQEKFRDPATGEMRGLNRDDIIHTMLFTAEKIGGDAAQRMILQFADKVQSGQLGSPGEGTSGFLLQAKRRDGSLGKRSAVSAAGVKMMSDEEIKTAMRTARGGLFTKQAQQIAALATLGRSRNPHAIPVILALMGAPEAILANAAQTALIQFLDPLPSSTEYEKLVSTIFLEEKHLKGPALERLLVAIQKSFPKRAPYDGVFGSRLDLISDGALRHRLNAAIRVEDVAPVTALPSEGDNPVSARVAALGGGVAIPRAANMSEADRRRLDALERKERHKQYLEAKRLWLKNGMQGPEPQPPE